MLYFDEKRYYWGSKQIKLVYSRELRENTLSSKDAISLYRITSNITYFLPANMRAKCVYKRTPGHKGILQKTQYQL